MIKKFLKIVKNPEYFSVGITILIALFFLVKQINENYIDFGEGSYLYVAWRIFKGERIYLDIFAPQPPVLFLVGGLLMKISQSVLFIRSVNLFLYLLGYILFYFLLSKIVVNKTVRFVGSLIYFILHNSVYWWATFTPETFMRPLLLILLIVLIQKKYTIKTYTFLFILLLLIAFLKYTSFIIILTTCIFLFIKNKKKGFIFTVVFGISFLLIVGLFYYLTNGQYLYQTFLFRKNIPYKDSIVQAHLLSKLIICYVPFAFLNLVSMKYMEKKILLQILPLHIFPVVFLCNSFLILLEGTYNYFIYPVEPLFLFGFIYVVSSFFIRKNKRIVLMSSISFAFLFLCIAVVFYYAQSSSYLYAYGSNKENTKIMQNERKHIWKYAKPYETILATPYLAYISRRKIVDNFSDSFFYLIEYAYNKKDKVKIDRYISKLEKKIRSKKIPIIILDWRLEIITPIRKSTLEVYKKSTTFKTEIEGGESYIR